MYADHLSRIPELSSLPQAELKALAVNTQVVCLPAQRWLFRHPRHSGVCYFLLKGQLHCLQPCRSLKAKRTGLLEQVYPGYGAARTLTPTQLLVVSRETLDFAKAAKPKLPNVEAAEPWLETFLNSHMMRALPKSSWQLLCRNFLFVRFKAGEAILRAGDEGDCAYVLAAGHAVVQRDAKTLCYLGPGDFFGEDALTSGRARNADVNALAEVQAYVIAQELFASLLLEPLVRFVPTVGDSVILDLDAALGSQAINPLTARDKALSLNPRVSYTLVGGNRRDRALCALLLIQRGLRANPLD